MLNPEAVVQSIDVSTILQGTLMMQKKSWILLYLKTELKEGIEPDLENWNEFLKKLKNPKSKVKIALVGKYVELQDSYKSILESIIHAGAMNDTKD